MRRPEREPGLAAELVRLKVDIIVVAAGDRPMLEHEELEKRIEALEARLSQPERNYR